MKLRLLKLALFLAMLIPAIYLLVAAINDSLGTDPIEYLLHSTGDWTLRFLLLTLAITPLRLLTGNAIVLRFRRIIGLCAFFYASLHFSVWFVLDQAMIVELIFEGIGQRPYITAGFTAWVLLIPLAFTSNKLMIRCLGKRWKMLHKLVYLIAALGGATFYGWLKPIC